MLHSKVMVVYVQRFTYLDSKLEEIPQGILIQKESCKASIMAIAYTRKLIYCRTEGNCLMTPAMLAAHWP